MERNGVEWNGTNVVSRPQGANIVSDQRGYGEVREWNERSEAEGSERNERTLGGME